MTVIHYLYWVLFFWLLLCFLSGIIFRLLFMLHLCCCLVVIFLSFLRMVGIWLLPLRSYFLIYVISGAIDSLTRVRSIINFQPLYALWCFFFHSSTRGCIYIECFLASHILCLLFFHFPIRNCMYYIPLSFSIKDVGSWIQEISHIILSHLVFWEEIHQLSILFSFLS